jgi:putative tryptophan/tyrosine transport system substrate-binding protein
LKYKVRVFPRELLLCIVLFLFFPILYTEQKVKIGLSVWKGYPESVKGFKEALKSGGYVEGKNIEFVDGNCKGDKKKLVEICKKFKKDKVSLIYSLTTSGTLVIKKEMPNSLPIIFSIVTYPDDSGLIDSFEYSANNLVGTSNYVPLKFYVDLLLKITPNVKTVAIFHRKKEPNSQMQASNMIRLLKKKNIKSIDLRPKSLEELKTMAQQHVGNVDVFMSTTDTLMQTGGEEILIELSLKHNIPILSSNKKGIESGSTFGAVADFYTLGKMSGEMAVKILKDGESPSSLESRTQDPPLFLVNKTSLEKLGLKLTPELKKKIKFTK